VTKTLLIIGLPKAGKTTFIAALWYVVETARVPGAMQLAKLPENRRHLNLIRERWVACAEQKHTSAGSEQEIRLALREPNGMDVVEVVVPDLSGESFEMQWSHRQWSRGYEELANEASGVLLFVHPDRMNDSPTISEATALGDLLEESSSSPNDSIVGATGESEQDVAASNAANVEELPWDSSFAPQQVKLVELLQFLTVRPLQRDRFRLAVIVSAWDRAKADGLAPDKWLERRMPLLAQFLKANHEVFQSQVFGISAIGGNLESEADRLLSITDPTTRIDIVGPGVGMHDITAPVRYVFE
jgi:hypothetical protein